MGKRTAALRLLHPETPGQDIFIQISESQVGRALRTKRWKYAVRAPLRNFSFHIPFLTGFFRASYDVYCEDFLYDLQEDPFERHNLIKTPKYKNIRKNLASLLKNKIKEFENKSPNIRENI